MSILINDPDVVVGQVEKARSAQFAPLRVTSSAFDRPSVVFVVKVLRLKHACRYSPPRTYLGVTLVVFFCKFFINRVDDSSSFLQHATFHTIRGTPAASCVSTGAAAIQTTKRCSWVCVPSADLTSISLCCSSPIICASCLRCAPLLMILSRYLLPSISLCCASRESFDTVVVSGVGEEKVEAEFVTPAHSSSRIVTGATAITAACSCCGIEWTGQVRETRRSAISF